MHTFRADIADRAATAAVEGAAAALGGIDILTSNAAAVAFGHFLETAPEDFDRTLAIALPAPVT